MIRSVAKLFITRVVAATVGSVSTPAERKLFDDYVTFMDNLSHLDESDVKYGRHLCA